MLAKLVILYQQVKPNNQGNRYSQQTSETSVGFYCVHLLRIAIFDHKPNIPKRLY